MKNSIILMLISIFFFSCKKEDIKTVKVPGKDIPIFPFKTGNIWSYTVVFYDIDSSEINRNTYTDTLTTPTIINGEQFWEFGFNYYRLADFFTVEMLGGLAFDDYYKKAPVFAYTYKKDTLWTSVNNTDVVFSLFGDTAVCIAYPDEEIVNGYRCSRTEILVYGTIVVSEPPVLSYKKVRYYSFGIGPVLEETYRLTDWYINENGNHFQSPGNFHFYKSMEINYKPVLVNYE